MISPENPLAPISREMAIQTIQAAARALFSMDEFCSRSRPGFNLFYVQVLVPDADDPAKPLALVSHGTDLAHGGLAHNASVVAFEGRVSSYPNTACIVRDGNVIGVAAADVPTAEMLASLIDVLLYGRALRLAEMKKRETVPA